MAGFNIGPRNLEGFRTGNPQIDKFMAHIEQQCKEHDIDLYLAESDKVGYASISCNGYFDPRLMRLAVAMGDTKAQHPGSGAEFKWLATLAHEFGHMTQWLEKCEAWTDMFFDPDALVDSETIIGLWMTKEVELNNEQLQRHLSAARGVEVDCEKRTLKLIDTFDLPINKEEYGKSANAYAYFWTTIRESRAWYEIGREPYNIKEILDLMPIIVYDNATYDDVPTPIWDAIMANCYKTMTEA